METGFLWRGTWLALEPTFIGHQSLDAFLSGPRLTLQAFRNRFIIYGASGVGRP